MRRVIGCTLAVLFSVTCAYAQPDAKDGADAKSKEGVPEVIKVVEVDYGELVQAEIRKSERERAAVDAEWDNARAAAMGGAKARLTGKVSSMMGLVPVAEPVSVPAPVPVGVSRDPGIVEQVELPETAQVVGAPIAEEDVAGFGATVEKVVAKALHDEGVQDSEFIHSGV